MSFDFHRFFGKSNSSKHVQKRCLQIESLENRELLSVSVAEFEAIRSQYQDLNLGHYADYHIIEVGASVLSGGTIRAAITDAATTTENDLIVVRTTEAQNSIVLSAPLTIEIDSNLYGSIQLVSLGDSNLALHAGSTGLAIIGSEVGLGGLEINAGNTGINSSSSKLTVTNCTISGITDVNGAAMVGMANDSLTITNCVISNNTRGLSFSRTVDEVIIANCDISNNALSGLVSIDNADVMVLNTVISQNGSLGGMNNGGGIYHTSTSGTITITNCTIAGNMAAAGGGIYSDSFQATINNSIVAQNVAAFYGNDICDVSNLTGRCNLIGDELGQTALVHGQNGNIVGTTAAPIDPKFVGADAGDFRLTADSQAWNAGNNALAVDDDGFTLQYDLEGKRRIVNGVVDMGAYEYAFLPAAPGNFRVTAQTGTSITLSWDAQPGLSGYTLRYRVQSSDSWQTWSPDPAVTATTATVQGLLPRTSYEFILMATNEAGSEISPTIQGATSVNAPTTPANFRSTTQTRNSVTLAWTGQNHLTEYTLQYRTINGEWQTWPESIAADATSVEVTGLTPNTNYEFQLTAVNEAGSALSSTQARTAFPVPTAPADFRSTAQTENSVTLAWTAQDYLTSYVLQYSKAGEVTWTTWPAPTTDATSATITGLMENTTYNFRLTAINSRGAETSTITAVTSAIAPPGVPAQFTSTIRTENSVILSWTAQGKLTGYTLRYRKSGDAAWTTWTAPVANASSATVTGLTAETAYEFQLTAINVGGSASATTTATTPPAPVVPLTPPTIMSLTPTGSSSLAVAWTSIQNADSYTIHFSTSPNFVNASTITAISATTTSLALTNLQPGTSYYVRIRAEGSGAFSTSPWSTTAQAATAPAINPPVAPLLFRSAAQTKNSVTLTWAGQSGLTGYTLQYRKSGEANWSAGTNLSPNVTNTTVTGLEAGTNYEFRLTAINAGGSASSETSATTVEIPSLPAPVHLRSVVTAQTAILLDWNSVSGATQYILQRKNAGGDFVTVYSGADSKFIDTGLTAGTSYEYRVQAVGSPFSEIVAISTAAASTPGGQPATDSPVIMEPVVVKDSQTGEATSVTIRWTDLGSDYSYTVYKAGRIVAQSYGGDSFTDNDPLPIAEYAVRAFNKVTQTSSDVAVAIVWAEVRPVEFTGYENTPQGGIKLHWDAQPDMTYQVLRLGHILASNLRAGEWTDATPQADNAYVLVATYIGDDGRMERTYSNTFTVKAPPGRARLDHSVFDIVWADFALNGDGIMGDDFLIQPAGGAAGNAG